MPAFSIDAFSDSSLADGWETSAATFPEKLTILQPDLIREAAACTELSDEAIKDVLETATLIASDPSLRQLAWHAYRSLYVADSRPTINDWPTDLPGLGPHTGTFYLLLALQGVEPMRAMHQRHGIPESVTRLNCRDIHIWAREYKTLGEPTDTGFTHTFDPPRWGLHTRGLRWTVGSLVGRILRIGRLQFIHNTFGSPFQAFRNDKTGKVQVVTEAGQKFTQEGWKAKDDDVEAWTSEFAEQGDVVIATPIRPTGRASRSPIELNTAEWTRILDANDSILEVHIPEDGPMGFDDCGASIAEVIHDFPTYYPDKPFKAIVCGSWLLDPQFQDGMPAKSNICRFQRECYLYPIGPGGGRSGFFRLFTHDDIATLPKDTVMRRTYLELLESGGLWRGGGMMLFPDDLDWGSQVYLTQHGLV